MAMEWSYNNAEVIDLCRDVLDSWDRQQLLDALAECETNDFVDQCFFEYDEDLSLTTMEWFIQQRLNHWNKADYLGYFFLEDFLIDRLMDRAEELRTCSNDFSEIFIDKRGHHRIALPDDCEVEND